MSDMYGPRKVIFHKTGVISICGNKGRSPMGIYKMSQFGIEVYMVDNPCLIPGRQLISIGHANTKLEAKQMIFKACKENSNHLMNKDEYMDGQGKIFVKKAEE